MCVLLFVKRYFLITTNQLFCFFLLKYKKYCARILSNLGGEMNIQIKMHSELDCPLRPDMDLILSAVEEMKKMPEIYNQQGVEMILAKVELVGKVVEDESEINAKIKQAPEDKKETLKLEKQCIIDRYNNLMNDALDLIERFGGSDVYGYTYDDHFNKIVAGLMGSTCYMKDTFEDLQNKRVKDIRVIAKVVEENGHHSTFGHSHLSLEITGIPKMLAMILNNEKEYNTSEKSARYTVMDNLAGKEAELYYKWKDIFANRIKIKYGNKQPFFDAKGTKVEKLAQENARYMLSVFTPTNMVYSTSFRQLNYLAHWCEDVINSNNPNPLYAKVIPQMQEFVSWMKDNALYSEKLSDGKDRKFSMFGAPLLKQTITSDVYAIASRQSFACLAQAQRHRTLAYHISDEEFECDEYELSKILDTLTKKISENPDYVLTDDEFDALAKLFYVPPILEDRKTQKEYLKDIISVAQNYPQARLLPVVERGTPENFLLKAKERVCVLAQKEIRDLTQSQCKQFARELEKEKADISSLIPSKPIRVIANKSNYIDKMQQQFKKMSLTARCSAGYNCKNPCKFGEGIGLQSLV